jgi:hypothetical protein
VAALRFPLAALALGGAIALAGAGQAQPEAEEPEAGENPAEEPEEPARPDLPGPQGRPEEDRILPPGAAITRTARALGKIRRSQGHVVTDEKLRKRLPPPPSGNIHLHNIYRQESLKVNIYNRDGSYNSDALKANRGCSWCCRTSTTGSASGGSR